MRSILLSGYYGFGNIGDEAILAATVKTIRAKRSDIDITVMSSAPEKTRLNYGVRAVNRMSPAHVLKEMTRCHLVVFGGGSLLQDVTSFRSLMYYLSVIYLAKMLSRPLMVYANGIGPISSSLGRRLTSIALSTARVITVRDEDSAEEIRRLGVTKDVQVTADPAFLLAPCGPEKVASIRERFGLSGLNSIVWISLRPDRAPESFYRAAVSVAASLQDGGFEPCFLVMHQDDRKICSWMNKELISSGRLPLKAVSGLSPEETLGILKEGVLCLGMRLHTLILAARAGVPFVGIEIDPKIASFCRAAGCPTIPDPSTQPHLDLTGTVKSAIGMLDTLASSLKSKLPLFQALAEKNVDIMLDILDSI